MSDTDGAGPRPLSPERLVVDLGRRSEAAQFGVRLLYDLLTAGRPPARQAMRRWSQLLGEASGRDPDQPTKGMRRMAGLYGVDVQTLHPAALRLAVETYYVRTVARLVRCILSGPDVAADEPVELFGSSNELFGWPGLLGDERVAGFSRRLNELVAMYDPTSLDEDSTRGVDLLGSLYQDLVPRPIRHALGEYYTPDWLVEHVLDEVGYDGHPDTRLLDPSCGSGTFLVRAVCRVLARHDSLPPSERPTRDVLRRKILANIVGFDLNPVAVFSSRANLAVALRGLLDDTGGREEIPVFLRDSILGDPSETPKVFDVVVGNPPWIAWDHLPDDYRQATKPLWKHYGLFSLSATAARHGGGKKDLAMLMLYVAADRHLKCRGRLAMVITQTVFQTKGAGDGFRRFQLGPDGQGLGVLRVHDMTAFQPFPGANNWTSVILLEKGLQTKYPLPYIKWSRNGQTADESDHRFHRVECTAEPIDPQRRNSPWFVRPRGSTLRIADLVGRADYRGRLGANTGGANGVYWIDVLEQTDDGVLARNLPGRSRRDVEQIEQVIEPDLLYPLLRWSDVSRYRAVPSAHLILSQDVQRRQGIEESVMRARWPRTLAYLQRFAPLLLERAAYKRYQGRAAFYSMYNVGVYTTAPVKVIWRRMDRRINAAVVEPWEDRLLGTRAVVPQETCVLIAVDNTDEAHYLAALLNSSPTHFLVVSHSVPGGKSFGTPGMLDYVPLGQFDPTNASHAELSALSREAHRLTACGEDVADTQRRINLGAAELWGIDPEELEGFP